MQTSIASSSFVAPALPAELCFDPVREQATRNGTPIEGRYWVVNPVNDKVIGIGKNIHRVENYNKMWTAMWDGLAASSLDLSEVSVQAHSVNDGAAMRATIDLPRHDFQPQLGEAAKMRISIVDSHDQSVRRTVKAMVLRLACLNGMLSVRESIGIAQRHTLFNDPEVVGSVASGWVGKLENDAYEMAKMRSIDVTEDSAIAFYRGNVARYNTASGVKTNEAMLERIIAIHRSYDLGNNAYRVYNTLTHLSTHIEASRRGGDAGRKQMRIEQDIEQVLRGPFARLLDEAAVH